jgi:uncharacterized peroxidase-related enzyme
MANIQVIQPSDADGYLKEVYDQILESRGKIAEIHKIQSLNPRSIIRHMDLYMTLMYGKSPLGREEREMLGVIVSKANNCDYCIAHHGEALNFYWKNKKKLEALIRDHNEVDIPEEQHLLCELADISTRFPDSRKVQPLIRKLKKHGMTDRAILDATLVISYFNFVNRLVMILDVKLEKDPGGYKY